VARELIHPSQRDSPRIVRLLPVLDEADVLEDNLEAWCGVETYAVDNASSDDSAEIARAAQQRGLLAGFEALKERRAWPEVAERLRALTRPQQGDIVVLAGADELFESADGAPLVDALRTDALRGATRMRFAAMEFCLCEADEAAEPNAFVRMRHYAHHAPGDRYRAFVWDESIDLSNPRAVRSGAPQSGSRRQYIARHYPLRSRAQANAKLAQRRLRPFLAGSLTAPLNGLVRTAEELTLPATVLVERREGERWESRNGAAFELLRRVSRTLGEHQRLRRRYAQVLLERDRLQAGVTGDPASAEWYDEMYRLNRDVYDMAPDDSPYHRAWQEIVERIPADAAVLEVGCGSGQLAQLLFERGLRDYTGFDFSAEAIELARARVPQARFEVDDARSTPLFSEATYDVVLCTEVLEHVGDDLALVRRARRGTRLVATVPSFDSASHLRYFTDADEARERYGPLLEELEVMPVELESGSVLFVLDGTL
jgi:protein-L-isoaspartate O-methyltransferase